MNKSNIGNVIFAEFPKKGSFETLGEGHSAKTFRLDEERRKRNGTRVQLPVPVHSSNIGYPSVLSRGIDWIFNHKG